MHKLTTFHFLILLFTLFSCGNNANTIIIDPAAIYAKKIIEVNELEFFQDDYHLKIIDLRPKDKFEKGHINGAIRLSRKDFEDTTSSIEGTMATKSQMENLLSACGIKNTDFIVIYDGKGNPDACRLLWILDHYGHKNKAILDGGFVAWKANGNPLSKTINTIKVSNYIFNVKQNIHYASLMDVKKAISDTNYCIIDVRSIEEFSGKELKGDVKRGGHIPSCIHIDYDKNIDHTNTYKFKSIVELKKLYSSISKEKKIIVYCHSGVRSALTTFVLTEILDYPHVQNYDGSWIEWSSKIELPIEN